MKFCSLYSGSSGNSLYVEGSHGRVLIDAGLSGIKISTALKQIESDINTIKGILVSHDHSDHVKGIGVLSRKYDIPLYMNEGTWNAVKDQIGKVKDDNIRLFENEKPIEIEDLIIKAFSIHHDAADPVGFSISSNKTKVSIVTDTGMMDEYIYESIKGSDLVVMESNHDVNMLMAGRYPYFLKKRVAGDKGHLSNECAADTVVKLAVEGLEKVVLAHLSEENNFPQLAMETTNNKLREHKLDDCVCVEVACRFSPGNIYNL
ncbi:MBL fold metallo-hydrolase [Alkalibacter saccharofermentans]|uniref:Phosphoribosyl 1,2-cyclic phosphodiesterase n=1 Tax=Alkalibacter saccharofermentans DSM 14828 TaxID=1120975 RepID=A0A1M4THY9_9FIRM|nr:MBL fold metallo-hydrolase [Alkalibacter saccharofermentans]SHE44081.1 Phosphoribosyl 1,2-cyclic phosphodiesterase [Alkalibacter saccharofermentans DSM 14828]